MTLYSTPTCPPCKVVKARLDARDVPYEVADIHSSDDALRRLHEGGYMTVPVMEFEDGRMVGGLTNILQAVFAS